MTTSSASSSAPRLEPAVAHRVIEHMNDDHADAVLLYVRAFGGMPQATAAQLTGIDLETMEIRFDQPAGPGQTLVRFDPPLRDAGEIRPRLVEMVAVARSLLQDGSGAED
jgi:putative heme iron utilization protein